MLFFDSIRNEIGIYNIADHYGFRHQANKIKEELQELIDAISDWEKTESDENFDHIVEELADVIVMSNQLQYLIAPKHGHKLEHIITMKIDRQLRRIQEEVMRRKLPESCNELNKLIGGRNDRLNEI